MSSAIGPPKIHLQCVNFPAGYLDTIKQYQGETGDFFVWAAVAGPAPETQV